MYVSEIYFWSLLGTNVANRLLGMAYYGRGYRIDVDETTKITGGGDIYRAFRSQRKGLDCIVSLAGAAVVDQNSRLNKSSSDCVGKYYPLIKLSQKSHLAVSDPSLTRIVLKTYLRHLAVADR